MTVRKSILNHNGLKVSYLESGPAGKGDAALVVFLHGYPEMSLSWTHQLQYFGDLGYWCVAPDQRGCGYTTGWDQNDVPSFSALNLCRDVIGFIHALGRKRALIVGHDVGTTPAFYLSLLRPDMVDGLCCMAVPLCTAPPKMQQNASAALERDLESLEPKGLLHYQKYFTTEKAVEEFSRDPEGYLTGTYHHLRGGSLTGRLFAEGKLMFPLALKAGTSFRENEPEPPRPSAGPEICCNFQELVSRYRVNGFRAPLNFYRNLRRNVDDLQLFAGAKLQMPYAFIGGQDDFLRPYYQKLLARASKAVPHLVGIHVIPGAGHWVQQERPEETNSHLLSFFRAALPRRSGSKL